jgi:hypothetical protein
MLANAIAEMRAYGEGFIIADQSPGLMDMAVIRNTNTKIIMRLPDESDRLLVGKAAGLNDEQIEELSKFETGVAAVSQSGWLESVLCRVGMLEEGERKPLRFNIKKWESKMILAMRKFFSNVFTESYEKLSGEDVDIIRRWKDKVEANTSLTNISRQNASDAIEKVIKHDQLIDVEKTCLFLAVIGKDASYIIPGFYKTVETVFMSEYGLAANSEVVRNIQNYFLTFLPGKERMAINEQITERSELLKWGLKI